MKKKTTAGIFALLFGSLGLHRFYLGQRRWARAYLVATIFLFIASVQNNGPFVMIMPLLGFIDAMLLFAMPKEDFDEKYNQRYFQREQVAEPSARQPMARPVAVAGPAQSTAKGNGIQKFKDYDFEGAVVDFRKALEEKFDDPAVHFNLACCYSLLERPDPAFFHLGKAVHFGFVDFDRIEQHDSLSFLRTLPAFREFAKNGYQHAAAPLTLPKEEAAAQEPAAPNLLDQLKKLEELRQQGILTEEEYHKMVNQ